MFAAVLAVILAIGAAIAIWQTIQSRVHPVPAVEATVFDPPMTRITASDLTVASVPRGRLGSQQPYASETPLIGQFSLYGLYPGEIISPLDLLRGITHTYDARLINLRERAAAAVAAARKAAAAAGVPADLLTSDGAPAAVPPMSVSANAALSRFTAAVTTQRNLQREMAVTLSLTQPQGFAIVHTGDWVSIFGTIRDASKKSVAYPVAKRVLILGRQGGAAGGAVQGAVSGLLVLAMTPGEIERLMLSQQAGSLLVVLNAPDSKTVTIGSVSSTSLLNGGAAANKTYPSVTGAASPGAVVPAGGTATG